MKNFEKTERRLQSIGFPPKKHVFARQLNILRLCSDTFLIFPILFYRCRRGKRVHFFRAEDEQRLWVVIISSTRIILAPFTASAHLSRTSNVPATFPARSMELRSCCDGESVSFLSALRYGMPLIFENSRASSSV